MLFPRAIRLDNSDLEVFESTAEPGEWAVVGSFIYYDSDPDKLQGKARQAFQHAFLGSNSFGYSTLVEIAQIHPAEFEEVVNRLAQHFVMHYGAPNLPAAMPAAREEAEFAASICDYDPHTILMVQRELKEDRLVESFKVVMPPSGDDHSKLKLWGQAD